MKKPISLLAITAMIIFGSLTLIKVAEAILINNSDHMSFKTDNHISIRNLTPNIYIACRRVKDLSFIAKVEEIFYELAREYGIESKISASFSQEIKLYARLLSVGKNIDFVRGKITDLIKEEKKLMRWSESLDEIYDASGEPEKSGIDKFRREVVPQAYILLKEFSERLSGIGLTAAIQSYEDFEKDIRLKTVLDAGMGGTIASNYLPICNKIILDIYATYNMTSSGPLSTLVHEGLHKLFPGFSNRLLNEGVTSLLTEIITGQPNHNRYKIPIEIAREIRDIVGEEALLTAYVTGSYDPLKGKLGDRLIGIFELLEITYGVPGYTDLVGKLIALVPADRRNDLLFSCDPLTALAWYVYRAGDEITLSALEKLFESLKDL